MDRFFSKLDLRDIKIKPEGSRFLPDEDEVEVTDEPVAASYPIEETVEVIEIDQEVDVVPGTNGHIVSATYESATYERVEIDTWQASAPAERDRQPSSNGQSPNDSEVLKVSAKSRPSAVAGAIAGVVRENGRAEVQAIGAGATNQAVKAIAIAREYLLETDIDAICIPAFIDVTIDNEERTAIRLVIERR